MNDGPKSTKPTDRHLRFRGALMDAVRKEATELDPQEILAISAHFVGQLTALQDQRKMNSAMVMEIVARNIEQGNRDAVSKLDSIDEGKPQ